MECQFGNEFADQAVQPGLGVGAPNTSAAAIDWGPGGPGPGR